jgi:hypothetical protein
VLWRAFATAGRVTSSITAAAACAVLRRGGYGFPDYVLDRDMYVCLFVYLFVV